MIEIALRQFELGVNKINGDNGAILVFKTPAGIIVTAYLDEEGKRNLAQALLGVSVATPDMMREIKRVR